MGQILKTHYFIACLKSCESPGGAHVCNIECLRSSRLDPLLSHKQFIFWRTAKEKRGPWGHPALHPWAVGRVACGPAPALPALLRKTASIDSLICKGHNKYVISDFCVLLIFIRQDEEKKNTLFLFFYLGMLHVHRPKSSTVDSLIYSQITSLWELFFLCNLPKVFFFFPVFSLLQV